jgi:hypothetical protein
MPCKLLKRLHSIRIKNGNAVIHNVAIR